MKGGVLCYGLWGDAEPGIFGHPDAFVVLIPDLEALEPIPMRGQLQVPEAIDYMLLTFANVQGTGQRLAIDGSLLVLPPSWLGRCSSVKVKRLH